MTAALIGRDHPAAVLRAEVERTRTSHGGLVLVAGEPGIGKTTLVTAAADEARKQGTLVLSGSCWDSDSVPGLWPWVQVVRSLRRACTPQEWAEATATTGGPLGVLLGERAPAGPDREGFPIFDAVTTALVAASQRRPVAVVLDDLHWADPASLRLLAFAAQHTWFERLLLIGTYRDVEVEAGGHPLEPLVLSLQAKATTVALTGLGRAEVADLMAATTGRRPDDALVAEVHRSTGGNPFFVEQTARLWHGGGAPGAVPPGVRDAVRHRLSRLPAPVEGLLRRAAALGREFDRDVLAVVRGAPGVDPPLAQAAAARLVAAVAPGRFAFVHDLVRETLYDGMGEAERRAAHAAVVRALDGAPELAARVFPADLARHAYLAGGDLDPTRARDLLLAAARDAGSRMAAEEAVGHLRRALDRTPDPDERRVWVLLQLAEAQHHLGEPDAARSRFQEAAELAMALPSAEPLTRVALTLHRFDRHDGAPLREQVFREAHRRLLGRAVVDRDSSTEAVVRELVAVATTQARSGADDESLALGLWVRHDLIWGLGTAVERVQLTGELTAVAERTADPDLACYAASLRWVALLEQGDPAYLAQVETFTALAEAADTRRSEAASTIDRAILTTLWGRFAESAELVGRSMAFAEAAHCEYRHMMLHLRWALALRQGRFPEAEAVLARMRADDYTHHGLLSAITALERGDPGPALRHVRANPGEPARAIAPLWLRMLAHTAAMTADPELVARARAALDPHRGEWAVSLFGCDVAGPVDLWLGLLDLAERRWGAAVERLTAARESADDLRALPWSVEARAYLVEVLRGSGQLAAAEALRVETLAEARRSDLRQIVTRLTTDPPPIGVPPPDRPAAGEALPPGVEMLPVPPPTPGISSTVDDRAPGARAPADGQAPLMGIGVMAVGARARSTGAKGGAGRGDRHDVARAEFRRDGAVWALTFAGRRVHVPDAKGLRDLHALLSSPGSDIPAVRLLDPAGGRQVVAARSLGGDPMIDDRARAEYRGRLDRLDAEIDHATALDDDERAAALDRERQALLEHLRAAAGLGGRARRLGDEAERARKAVTARIRDTLRKLESRHPPLAAHLRAAVSTGSSCRYDPDGAVHWRL